MASEQVELAQVYSCVWHNMCNQLPKTQCPYSCLATKYTLEPVISSLQYPYEYDEGETVMVIVVSSV